MASTKKIGQSLVRPLLGAHVSASGGLFNSIGRAVAMGAETIQIFGASPRIWMATMPSDATIAEFKKQAAAQKMGPIFLHASYFVNLASTNPELVDNLSVGIATPIPKAENI